MDKKEQQKSAATDSASYSEYDEEEEEEEDEETVEEEEEEEEEADDIEDSHHDVFEAISNHEKVRKDGELERAKTSDEEEEESEISLPHRRHRHKHRRHHHHKPSPPRVVEIGDKLEEEMQTVVRKARMLARIQQLTTRGAKPSKLFDHRSSEHELQIEIARMEVVAERGMRIKQGRMALTAFSASVEKAAGMWDQRFADYITFQIQGVTRDLIMNIVQFDDALEQGVEELIGPQGQIPWYYRLLYGYGALCVERTSINRTSPSTPQFTADDIVKDAQLRKKVMDEVYKADNIMRENHQRQTINATQNALPATTMRRNDVTIQ